VRDEKVVGTYIIGSHAGEMIGEAALAVKMALAPKDIFETMHTHPTLPESFAEALRAVSNEYLHLPPTVRARK
jgi:dihydrolipoamide dehydrogenase